MNPDADAVFVPARMMKSLKSTYKVEDGSRYVNYPYVKSGFSGNIRVFSKSAFGMLLTHPDDCEADLDTINCETCDDDGKCGPMGNTLLASECPES